MGFDVLNVARLFLYVVVKRGYLISGIGHGQFQLVDLVAELLIFNALVSYLRLVFSDILLKFLNQHFIFLDLLLLVLDLRGLGLVQRRLLLHRQRQRLVLVLRLVQLSLKLLVGVLRLVQLASELIVRALQLYHGALEFFCAGRKRFDL